MNNLTLCKPPEKIHPDPVDEVIKEKWGRKIHDYNEGRAKIRKIKNFFGTEAELVYSKRRAAHRNYHYKTCPFTNFKHKRGFMLGNFAVIPNLYPYAPHHRLLVARRHYPYPKLRDLEFIIRFSNLVNDSIILSLRGSGAGIPAHMHFQAFPIKLPVFNAKTKKLFSNKDVVVEKIIFPSRAIIVKGKNSAKWLYKITQKISFPYNLAIHNGAAYLFPRSTLFPSNLKEWKFGATEVSGYFITRNIESFNSLTKKQLVKFMKTATVPKKVDAQKFYKEVKEAIENCQ